MEDWEKSGGPILDKKQAISILQWLIVIVTSYLLLFSKGTASEDPRVYGLIIIFLASSLVIRRLPEAVFQHRYFDIALLVTDTALISASIYMNRDVPWDLFLFYFFILFLAAIGENMVRIVIGSVLISLVYVGLLVEQGKGPGQHGPGRAARNPKRVPGCPERRGARAGRLNRGLARDVRAASPRSRDEQQMGDL